jgi:hypothetical protein
MDEDEVGLDGVGAIKVVSLWYCESAAEFDSMPYVGTRIIIYRLSRRFKLGPENLGERQTLWRRRTPHPR